MSDGNYTFSCPRCGNEVNGNSRYCMKCGYLNPSHPDNQQYMNLIQGQKESYTVTNGSLSNVNVNINEVRATGVDVAFGNNTGSFMICFILNFVFYFVSVLGLFGACYSLYNGNIQMVFASELCYLLFGLTIFSIINYSIQLVYMKMNCRWWAPFIPFYNLYAMSVALDGKKWVNFLVFIPFIGQLYYIVLLYKMGVAFKVSGFLTVLFPFIMFPVIGFGSNGFNNVCYISERDSLEKEYKKKKTFFVVSIIVLILCVVMFIYSNTVSINKGMDKFSSYYLYYAADRVMTRTELKVENDVIECDDDSFPKYLYFPSLDDYFNIPFYVYRDPIEAYVKVVRVNGELEYYISMTDKKYGFPETKFDDVKIESIVEYKELDKSYESGNICYFKRSA